jgi:hypothetical protein
MGFARRSEPDSSSHRNRFFTLRTASTDGQNQIVELDEDRAASIEPQIQKARSDLANSRSRFSAELAWFPGVSATRAFATPEGINADPFEARSDLPPLARANLLAARIEGLLVPERDIVRNLLELAVASEGIDAQTVMLDINQSRSLAGVPPADDMRQLLSELAARRRYYRDVAWRFLNGLSTRTLVQLVTELVAKSTDGAQKRALPLMEEIVDDYEAAARGFIEGESYNVKKLVALIRLRVARNEPNINGLIRSLNASLVNWSYVTKPIQLASRSKQCDHPATYRLAAHVRSLALELRTHHALSGAANETMQCLLKEFALLSEFYDQTPKENADTERPNEDANTEQVRLDVKGERFPTRNRNEEIDRGASYTVDVGQILKRRLEISASGLSWEGRTYKFDEIDRVRWSYSKYSIRGLAAGKKYSIRFRTSNLGAAIHTNRADIYNDIVNRLWRTVGARILFEYVEQLKRGNRLVFPCASVEDIGVTLPIKRMFHVKNEVRVPWSNIRMSSTERFLVIDTKGDGRVCAAMSYAKTDNLHVLEHLIGLVLTSEKPTVSEILH